MQCKRKPGRGTTAIGCCANHQAQMIFLPKPSIPILNKPNYCAKGKEEKVWDE